MKKVSTWIVFCLLLIFNDLGIQAQCSTTGAKNGGLFNNNTNTGIVGWANPSNAISSNAISSISAGLVTTGITTTSNYLYVQNFGFNIPANAIICGIALKLEHKQEGASGTSSVKDNAIYLTKTSGLAGTNHALPWDWTSFYANVVHGSSSDTWGTTWTAADINSPNFGAAISVKLSSSGGDIFLAADIDHVSITVFYTVPLPIELTHFTASVINNKEVKLEWSTESEINNDFFSVQRSKDGITWEEIEQVPGNLNSNSLVEYTTTDPHPYPGNSYYRLAQTDINGDIHYSNISSIHFKPTEHIYIEYNGNNRTIEISAFEPITVGIYNCSGNTIKNIPFTTTEGYMQITTDEMLAGLYIVIAESANEKITKKIYLQ
jgi:hypothetical protein